MLLGQLGLVLLCATTTAASPLLAPRDGPTLPKAVGESFLSHLKSKGALDAMSPNLRAGFEAGILEGLPEGSGQACLATPDPGPPQNRRRRRGMPTMEYDHQTGTALNEPQRYTPLALQNERLTRREQSSSEGEGGQNQPDENEAFGRGYEEGFERGRESGLTEGIFIGSYLGGKKCLYERQIGRDVSWGEVKDQLDGWSDEAHTAWGRGVAERALRQPRTDQDDLNEFATNAMDLGGRLVAPLSAVAAAAGAAISYGVSNTRNWVPTN